MTRWRETARTGLVRAGLAAFTAWLVVAGAISPIPKLAEASVAHRSGTFVWDTQADFETNTSTTHETTSRQGISTTRTAGAVRLNGPVCVAISGGGLTNVGLMHDGTVVAAGNDSWGQRSGVATWTDIAAVSAGEEHNLGLKPDGTVVVVGRPTNGRTDVSGWNNVVAIAAGGRHSAGLRADGTCVAVGDNINGQLSVGGWRDIDAIAAGHAHTVGLTSTGTVVAAGGGPQTAVSGWGEIVRIAAGYQQTYGLKPDGTVVAAGADNYSQVSNVSTWTGVVDIASGQSHTVGLKADGTCMAVGDGAYGRCNVSSWTDVVHIAAGVYSTVGLRSDGTCLAVGLNTSGISGWTLWPGVGPRAGVIGGANAVGLRADGGEAFWRWKSLTFGTAWLTHGESIKVAVRASDDGVHWSGPLGRDGQPIDWTSRTGNYFGSACGDFTWCGDLSRIPRKRYIDLEVRLGSAGVTSPELKSIALTCDAGNLGPTAVGDTASCDEDSRTAINVLANDSDPNGDALEATLVAGPVNGTLTLDTSGEATYTPQPDFYGTDVLTYRATDGLLAELATVTITVAPVSDATTFAIASASRTLAKYGEAFTLVGNLISSAMPLGSKRVVLQTAPTSAGPWADTSIASVTTTGTGTFSLSRVPRSKAYYRAVFAGEGLHYDACESDVRYALPRAWVGTPVAPSVMYANRSATVYGYLKPRHTAGTYPVRIYKYRYVSGKWKNYGYVKAKARNYSTYTKYAASVKLPYRGRWRLRAYHPADAGHAASWSAKYDYVTVK